MSKVMPLSTRDYNSADNSATRSLFKYRFIAGFTVAAFSLPSLINPIVVVPAAVEVGNQTVGVVNGSDVLTSATPGVTDRVILSLIEDTSTDMNVTFHADTAGTTIEYRPTSINQVRIATTVKTGRINRVHQLAELADLTPATEYEYRIITAGGASGPWDTFHTAATAPQGFDFIHFGDVQNGLTEEMKTSVRAAYNAVPNVALAVHTGDQINDVDNDEQRDQWPKAQGLTAHKTPMLTTLGNHKLKGDLLARNFQNHHAHPANGPAVLPESTYYVDYQGVRPTTLISNNLFLPQRVRLLDEVLSSNPNQWSVVMFHRPVYNATVKQITITNLRYFGDILKRYNVDLVLNDYDHAYARGHHFDDEVDGENTDPIYIVSSVGLKFYETEPEDATWDNNGANRKIWAEGATTYAKTPIQGYTMATDSVTTHEGVDNRASTSVDDAGQIVDSFIIDKCDEPKQIRDNI